LKTIKKCFGQGRLKKKIFPGAEKMVEIRLPGTNVMYGNVAGGGVPPQMSVAVWGGLPTPPRARAAPKTNILAYLRGGHPPKGSRDSTNDMGGSTPHGHL